MKDLLPWLLLAALVGAWIIDRNTTERPVTASVLPVAETIVPPSDPGQVFQLSDLVTQLKASGRAYLPFLDEPTLRTGLYALPAGAEDRQEPHDKDEVYYVMEGRAKIKVGDEEYEVQPGSVIFVAAQVTHRFYTITEDLQLLVFFSGAARE